MVIVRSASSGVRSERREDGGVHPRGLREQAQGAAAAAAADAAGGEQPRRVPAGGAGDPGPGEPAGAGSVPDADRRVAVRRQIPGRHRRRGGGDRGLAVGASPPLRLLQAVLGGAEWLERRACRPE